MLLPGRDPLVPFLGTVVSHNKSVFGKLFVETFGSDTVDEEVKRVRNGAEGENREERSHVGGFFFDNWVKRCVCVDGKVRNCLLAQLESSGYRQKGRRNRRVVPCSRLRKGIVASGVSIAYLA